MGIVANIIFSIVLLFSILFFGTSIIALFSFIEFPKFWIYKKWILILGAISMFIMLVLGMLLYIAKDESKQPKPEYKVVEKVLYEKI